MTHRNTHGRRRRGLPAALVAVLGLVSGATLLSQPVPRQTGISGFSGNPATGGQTCTFCHGGGATPVVEIEGPDRVLPGSTNSYTITVRGGQAIAAGIDVSATSGALSVIDAGTQLMNQEITHIAPRDVDGAGDAAFQFAWTAPNSSTSLKLYAAGNSVNRDNQTGGDNSRAIIFDIDVVDCSLDFAEYGNGLAGSGGKVPILTGEGGACDAGVIKIREGLGGAPGVLMVALASAQLPFFGGDLLVDPGAGWLALPIQLGGPAGIPGFGILDLTGFDVTELFGLSVYLQAALVDSGAVQGVSLSNGLEMIAQ